MQTPGPTWKRRSTSAAKADILLRSILFMVCGVLVACPWRVGAATVASHEPYPFQVTGFESGRTWTFVTLEGGDIGRVDTDEIRQGDLSSVIDLLQRHSEWTGAEEDLELATVDVSSRNILVTQLVQGMRVDMPTTIRTDGHGNVTRLSCVIVHPNAIDNLPTILEGDAVEIAKQAVRNYSGLSDTVVRTVDNPERIGIEGWKVGPTLYLELQEVDDPPLFYWAMEIYSRSSAGTGLYNVLVDAHSGEARVSSATRH